MGTIQCCESKQSVLLAKCNPNPPKNCYGYTGSEKFDSMNLLSQDARPLSIFNLSQKTSTHKKVSIDDFSVLKILGKGSFGKVLLVEKLDTKKTFAMKVIKKNTLSKKSQSLHTKTEREILENMNSPFILQLHYAFQTDDKLYLVMDFMSGGELFFHLRKERKFLESKARFYAAEITLALEYLHSHGIVYRDLKPENILIGEDGHIKIADFNLSKQGLREGVKTYTFCGTPEYLAPEILQGRGHDKAVDYWALGALIYEMLAGMPPFHCRDKNQMFMNILKKPVEMKPYFSKEACSLLTSLLVVDPTKRLSNMNELKKHEFFRDLDWDRLARSEIKPPFVPKIKDEKDLKYFDKSLTDDFDTPCGSPHKKGSGETCQGSTYKGFTYDAAFKVNDILDLEEQSTEDPSHCHGANATNTTATTKVKIWHKLSI